MNTKEKTIYVENYQFSYVTKKYNYTQYKCNNMKFCKATILFYEDGTTKSFNHSGKCRMKHITFNNKKNTNKSNADESNSKIESTDIVDYKSEISLIQINSTPMILNKHTKDTLEKKENDDKEGLNKSQETITSIEEEIEEKKIWWDSSIFPLKKF